MRRPTLPLLACASLAALAGCTDETSRPSARLVPLADCGAARDYVKQVAIERMNKAIDEALAEYAAGQRCYNGWGEGDASGAGSGSGGGVPPAPTQGTGTNNQIAGVDEADFIKNDGQYIYLAQNGVFRIVDAWPADQTHTVSTTPITGDPKQLFVLGDTALVYVSSNPSSPYSRDCTYGYDCDFSGDGSSTKVLVFDIADRTAPHQTREIDLSGSLVAARRVGSAVHTVVTQSAQLFPDLRYDAAVNCSYSGTTPDFVSMLQAKNAYELLRQQNRALIESSDLATRLPNLTDSSGLTAEGEAASCSDLYASSINDGSAFTSIVSLDLDHPGPVKTSTIISRAGAVFASADALYMAVPHAWNGTDLSTVHKFRISEIAGQTRYLASGLVTGRALNQFSMDEQDGRLRIATTDGHPPDPNSVSYLSVLEEQGKALVTVGQVDGIAKSEDIRAVRFDGNRAFIVTFKKTDPLFAFDLSDPTAPHMLGELQIPGFSTYIHMVDDHHLLTIGYDADDHGSFAFFNSVIVQLFDVTDMTAPALAAKYVIGTRGSSSEALTNHLAFTWYPEESILALPMTICEGGGDGQYGTTMTFSGLMLFDASIANSTIAERGRVPHTVPSTVTCSTWWADATSAVKRSLFLDRFVYSISNAELKVRSIDALATELVTVPLQ